jgi:hypothetical protein
MKYMSDSPKKSEDRDEQDDIDTMRLNLDDMTGIRVSQEEVGLDSDIEFGASGNSRDLTQSELSINDLSASGLSLGPSTEARTKVVLFDFGSDLFQQSINSFPKQGYDYQIFNDIKDLSQQLKKKDFQICFLNYDAQPKAVNQLSAQIKVKMPHVRTVIVGKKLAPDKVQAHQRSKYGANGYYRLPFETDKLLEELNDLKNS